LFVVGLVAALPSLLYYGHSYLVTGHFSVSAASRSLTLVDSAPTLAGLRYSLEPARQLLASPLVILAGFALWAWETRGPKEPSRHALRLCAAVVLAYGFIVTFVVPANMSTGRYLLPMLPFLAAMASVGMNDLTSAGFRGHHRLIVVGLVGALLVAPAFGALRLAVRERGRGWDFNVIMEKSAADWLNNTAHPDAQVLTHEVQVRYFLRDDVRVLSIDGITDGKAVPFLESGDMRSFLLRHRPDYWVVNDTVFARPYLEKSILRRAAEALGNRVDASIEIEGIRFTNLASNHDQRHEAFAGYRQLFALTYADDPAASFRF
jgi:hypothetical protein